MTLALALLLSFIRVDVESGAVNARDWPSEPPVNTGSLLKPFIALAYAQSHQFQYPQITCKRCWLPRGHGRLTIENAIAQSCNTYFDELRAQTPDGDFAATLRRFGITTYPQVQPEDILRAYIELTRRKTEPGIAPLLEGMRRAATIGTAKELAIPDAFAKTGTAPCTHKPKAPGDGFAIILTPTQQPRTAIIVRLHGRPGAHAAREAGGLLRQNR